MTGVSNWPTVHDPNADWCACEPLSDNRCGYRLLADEVVEKFNPRDDDAAEVSICIDALAAAADYIASIPCTCTAAVTDPTKYDEPCTRCQVLGRRADKVEDR